MTEKKGRGSYSREFKEDAVRLVTDKGVSVSQVAIDLGIHENTIYKWMRQYSADPAGAFPGKGGAFFGAMNTEMHLNTDSALSLLRQGKVPEGNEFVMVGGELLEKLNFAEVKARGYGFGDLPGGGVIIQMADKWEGRSAV